MAIDDVQVGGLYVNEDKRLVRHVGAIDDGRVTWSDFGLSDGEPIGFGNCAIGTFAYWATREATREEMGRMQWGKARDKDRKYVEGLVERLPSVMIHSEHLKRGLLSRYLRETGASAEQRQQLLAAIPDEEIEREYQRRAAERSPSATVDADVAAGEHLIGAVVPTRRRKSRRNP